MLALQAYEAACCGGCGAFLPDTTAAEAEDTFRVQAARCHRCTAIAQEADGYKDNPHPQALHYHVGRR
jgi:methionyl-tRNA synthetase